MAAYRRFVAYVYEYRKDKKGVNCGFVRIEAQGNICRVELHLLCPGLISGSKCSVYGFVRRDDGTDGILLGMCETEKEQINCILETSSEHMGDSEHSLEGMGGMIITTDQGGFFGTEWDDMPIRPEKFRVVPELEKNKQGALQTDEGLETDKIQENGEREENSRTEVLDGGKENITEKISKTETKRDAENPEKEKWDAERRKAESPQTEAEVAKGQELHTQSVAEQDVQSTQNVETASPGQEALNEQEKKTQEQKTQNFHMCGASYDAFKDGELYDCRKISPQDLCHMGRRTCLLRNNRFVQYGYYHFGHLLLCRNHCGQPVLGVPGRYDQQERFMANMFGFPYFKESSEIQVPGGRGGYWYRLIDAANPDNGNGC